MKNIFIAASLLALPWGAAAQDLSAFQWRAIGPATTSGRIADLAVAPDQPDTWYIAAASGGVWKTTNHGVTFEPLFDGQSSYSMGCLALDPTNSNVVWVGTGENNNQRSVAYGDGIYKSTDGGKSWKNMGLKASERIGRIVVHPTQPNTVYVAAYGPVWNAGGERGIYKTTDGGETWTRILHVSDQTGFNEIHLDPRNPDVLYATAHQRRRHEWTYISGGPESGLHISRDGGKTWTKASNGFPGGEIGRIGMSLSPVNPDVVYAAVEGSGFYRSVDRGASWSKMSDHSTAGNYYSEIFASPHDVHTVYSMDTYAQVTRDGGKSFKAVGEPGKHVDNHALWLDPKNPAHFLMGCDGGLYETWDNAGTWHYKPNLSITQFYRVTVDNSAPFYNVYGGTQDNFSLGGPSRTINDRGIVNSDWFVTQEGDGFESQIDPSNPNIVYAQAQYGWVSRFDRLSGEKVPIQPVSPPGVKPYRWNWDAPLLISPHDPATLYFAANVVFKSTNRGNEWSTVSPDLSKQIDRNTLPVMGKVWSMDAVAKNQSTSIYGNVLSLAESPVKKGWLYAGTDDGLIQVSTNDGGSWTRVESFPGIPANTPVVDLEPSRHNPEVVYALFNNHRQGDFKPYVLKSTNNGKSWTNITADLPVRGSVHTLAEDHVDPNLLFVGTEFGIYCSLDGGKSWKALGSGLPTIAVRDIDVQRRENDLAIATFGRGFYILDDYSPLRHLSKETLEKPAAILPVKDGLVFHTANPLGYGPPGFMGASYFMAENPPMGAVFTVHVKDVPKSLKAQRQEKEKSGVTGYPSAEAIRAEDQEEKAYHLYVVYDSNGKEVRRFSQAAAKGIQRVVWDGELGRMDGSSRGSEPITTAPGAHFAPEGTYQVSMYQLVNGVGSLLAGPVSFRLNHLKNGTTHPTAPADEAARNAFWADANKTTQSLESVERTFRVLKEHVVELKAGLRNTPGASLETLAEARKLEVQLAAWGIELYGDGSMSKREFETAPGLTDRMGNATWGSWSHRSAPTSTMVGDLAAVKTGVAALAPQLAAAWASLKKLDAELVKAGGMSVLATDLD